MSDVKEVSFLRDQLGGTNLAELNAQERDAVEKRMKALDELFKRDARAKYKLEIHIHEERSTWKPFFGIMYFLLSGDKLHGGGDTKVYLCADSGCHGVIYPPEHTIVDISENADPTAPAKVLCPKCERVYLARDLWGERGLRLTAKDWARSIFNNYMYLEANADIVLLSHHANLQKQTALEIEKNAGSELVDVARRVRHKVVYPLKNVIKDVSAGADLVSRFQAFINS
jgi:hypothetical protein